MNNLEDLLGFSANALGVLLPAFRVVEQMSSTYKGIKFAKARCKAVIRRAAFIIKGVHESAQKTRVGIPISQLEELEQKFTDIQTIMEKLANMSFLKALLSSDLISQEIETADHHLSDCLHMFQIELLFRARAENDGAAASDKAVLHDILKELKGNYTKIRRTFAINNSEEEDQAMVAMEQKLSQVDKSSQDAVETQIIKSSLECIKSSTGKSTPKQSAWLITEYELDFGGEIGGGGFSTVRRAKFRGTMVAVKVLKDVGNSKKALEREIDIWSGLRHDHIVPFYGASTLTSNPYIVCRYMRNGNLIAYLSKHPSADRTKLIYEISLGMFYLHGEKVVHGDLKGINVLVDDAGKACITDFGLSCINSSVNTEETTNKISGTLRFLAPEALKGQPLNFATDVYAFGMVIYEVFAEEGPFVGVPDEDIMRGNLTLTRPTSNRALTLGLNDTIWQLFLDVTSRNPAARPLFATIAKRLEPAKEQLFSQTFELANSDTSGGEYETNWMHGLMSTSSPTLNDSRTPLIQNVLSSGKPSPVSTPSPAFADGHKTNWAYGPTTTTSPTLINSETSPLIQKVVSNQPSFASISPVLDVNNVMPVAVEVALRYFNSEFGLVKSREPGVYIKENESSHWQPISAKKGTLVQEETNRFMYRRTVGEGTNSWEVDGNRVMLHSPSVNVECRFGDARTARKWFDLQLNFARNGSVALWGTSRATGDCITRTRSWRRVARGKLQMAQPLERTPNLPPSSWSTVDLPTGKRYAIDSSHGDMNSVTCILNPDSSKSSKYCCNVRGRTVAFTTYRFSDDRIPTQVKEETYPSEAEAQAIFSITKAILEKGKKY